jgi:hypothetical protein
MLRKVPDDGGLGGYAYERDGQTGGEHEDSSHGASLQVENDTRLRKVRRSLRLGNFVTQLSLKSVEHDGFHDLLIAANL